MAAPAVQQHPDNVYRLHVLQSTPAAAMCSTRTKTRVLLLLLVVFVLVALWQTYQIRRLSAFTRTLREETAQVQLAHNALEDEFLARRIAV